MLKGNAWASRELGLIIKRRLSSPESQFRLVKKIEIRYLRSLYLATLKEAGDLNLLFGRNDSGKSNFLRALNLFFNNETGPTSDLDFSLDFSDIRRQEAKDTKGKQFISVRIDFNVPDNFRRSLGDSVSIKRQWNISGEMTETPPKNLSKGAKIQLTKFLNQIDYTYIPAIKDIDVFDDLIERMYVAAAAKTELSGSVGKFIEAIRKETTTLSTRLTSVLQTGTKLAAPTEMGRLFRSMDFSLGEESHSLLLQKGDGIKARHIPELLRFINENENGKKFFIWGFEEPENSLDFSAAEAESENFANIAARTDTQIFISSHSPAFYLAEPSSGSNCKVKRFFVSKQIKIQEKNDVEPLEAVSEIDTLESAEEMMSKASLMQLPFLIKKWGEQKKILSNLEVTVNSLRGEFTLGKPVLFVEGESDRMVIEKCIPVFFPNIVNDLQIRSKKSGAGENYVFDMVSAWRSLHKHDNAKPKSAGLLDNDNRVVNGEDRVASWNDGKGNVESAKCFRVIQPQWLHSLLSEGFKIPVVLETLYSIDMWNKANQLGYLEDAGLVGRLPKKISEAILSGKSKLEDHIDLSFDLIIKKKFRNFKKIEMAEYICGLDDSSLKEHLFSIQATLQPILNYLHVIDASEP